MEAIVAIAVALFTFIYTSIRMNRDTDRGYTQDLERRLLQAEKERDAFRLDKEASDRENLRLTRELNHLWRELDQYERKPPQ